jgi:hypothetical protein
LTTNARRVKQGKGHSYTINDKPLDGITTMISEGLPKPFLVGWAAGAVAEYLVERRELLPSLTDFELLTLAKSAPNRQRKEAALRGGELHALAARLAGGEEVDVPEPHLGLVDSYLDFLDEYQPANALVERPCFNRTHRLAGTFDMLAQIDRPYMKGTVLFDIKTSNKGIYGEIGIQLAGYAHSEFYVDEDGAEQPMPAIDHYVALWVRSDGYDAYEIDVTDREWRALQAVQYVAWWRRSREKVVVGDSMWRRTRQEVSG